MDNANLPRHVAVIMDGNGRWAQKRGLSRINGHIAGAKKVPEVADHLFLRGVETVTLYAFSEENYSRPKEETDGIFERIRNFAATYPSGRLQGRVRLIFSGDLAKVSSELREACLSAELRTKASSPYTLNVLLNYGGRSEIIRAAGLLSGETVTEESFRRKLYSADLPDPDLIIRTGGEKRLSGFMPFQSAYSELYFCDTLFPDFGKDDIDLALSDYSARERRFGKIK